MELDKIKKKKKENLNIAPFSDLSIDNKKMEIEYKIIDHNKEIMKNDKLMKDLNYGMMTKEFNLYKEKRGTSINQKKCTETLNYKPKKNTSSKKTNDRILSPKNNSFIPQFIRNHMDGYETEKIKNKLKTEKTNKTKAIFNNLNIVKDLNFYSDPVILNPELYMKFESGKSHPRINSCSTQSNQENNSDKKKFKRKHKMTLTGVDFKLISNINNCTSNIDKELLENVFNQEYNKIKKKIKEKKYIEIITAKQNKVNTQDSSSSSANLDKLVDKEINKNYIYNSINPKSIKKLNKLRGDILNLIKRSKDDPEHLKVYKYTKYIGKKVGKDTNLFKYYNYLPETNEYKDIKFMKNCIFNNEFIKRKRKYKIRNIKCLEIRNKSANNKSVPGLSELLVKTNSIRKQSSQIKNILEKDKMITDTLIDKVQKKRRNQSNEDDMLFKDEIKRNNFFNKFIGDENNLLTENNFPFKNLRLSIYKGIKLNSANSNLDTEFNKTLNKYCKKEKRNDIEIKNLFNNNYYLRLKRNKILSEKNNKSLCKIREQHNKLQDLQLKINNREFINSNKD